MINRLKEEISFKLGNEIQNRGDCELLSNQILNETGEFVSYNTLRRFFTIDQKTVSPRVSTLDILARYVGYQSFGHFISVDPQHRFFQQNLEIAEIVHYDDTSLISTHYKRICKNQRQVIDFLIYLICDYIYRGKHQSLIEILDTLSVDSSRFSYDEKLYIGNRVGLSLRNSHFRLKAASPLFRNSILNEFVFEIFVDYSSLNGYYSKFISTKPVSHTQRIFKYSLKQFKAYLNNKTPLPIRKFISRAVNEDLHPILKGRLLSLELIVPHIQTAHILDAPVPNTIDFWYEPMVASIITSDFRFFQVIDREISQHYSVRNYRSNHYFNVFFLTRTCYYYQTGQTDQARHNLSLINTDEMRLSYKEFLSFFYHLVAWKLNHDPIHRRYTNFFAQRLNYPKFNQTFIENY
jgi:hypothetical protein